MTSGWRAMQERRWIMHKFKQGVHSVGMHDVGVFLFCYNVVNMRKKSLWNFNIPTTIFYCGIILSRLFDFTLQQRISIIKTIDDVKHQFLFTFWCLLIGHLSQSTDTYSCLSLSCMNCYVICLDHFCPNIFWNCYCLTWKS